MTDVKRKEVHTQKDRRTILGRFVRGGGRMPGDLEHRYGTNMCIHSFIYACMHPSSNACLHATNSNQAPTLILTNDTMESKSLALIISLFCWGKKRNPDYIKLQFGVVGLESKCTIFTIPILIGNPKCSISFQLLQ